MNDPNEEALEELVKWLAQHEFQFHFSPNDNDEPPTVMYIHFKDPVDAMSKFRRLWATASLGIEAPKGSWMNWVRFDYSGAPFFQRKRCVHCDRAFSEHQEGKCLFGSTTFTVKDFERLSS